MTDYGAQNQTIKAYAVLMIWKHGITNSYVQKPPVMSKIIHKLKNKSDLFNHKS